MPFEWDDAKDKANRERHGLSFEDVVELFTSGVDISARSATKKEIQLFHQHLEGKRD